MHMHEVNKHLISFKCIAYVWFENVVMQVSLKLRNQIFCSYYDTKGRLAFSHGMCI